MRPLRTPLDESLSQSIALQLRDLRLRREGVGVFSALTREEEELGEDFKAAQLAENLRFYVKSNRALCQGMTSCAI